MHDAIAAAACVLPMLLPLSWHQGGGCTPCEAQHARQEACLNQIHAAIRCAMLHVAGSAMANGLLDSQTGKYMQLPPFSLRSGPRRTIYYDPKQVTAAVVTCGGLCPGLNDVVQNIVYTLVRWCVCEGVRECVLAGGGRGWGSGEEHSQPSMHAHLVLGSIDGACLRAQPTCSASLYTLHHALRHALPCCACYAGRLRSP